LRPLAHGVPIGVAVVPAAEGGIDTEDDLARANRLWQQFSAAAASVRST
jgi:CMP-2-keto-3-deoxyoctulosonic acid synthetase